VHVVAEATVAFQPRSKAMSGMLGLFNDYSFVGVV